MFSICALGLLFLNIKFYRDVHKQLLSLFFLINNSSLPIVAIAVLGN